mgnify:CR=1 FL=1
MERIFKINDIFQKALVYKKNLEICQYFAQELQIDRYTYVIRILRITCLAFTDKQKITFLDPL